MDVNNRAVSRAGPQGAEPDDADRTREMGRRTFVSTIGVAALGLVAGCSPVRRLSSTARRSSAGAQAGSSAVESSATTVTAGSALDPSIWSPLADLSTVSVAADPAARDYPSLTSLADFDRHPAVALLNRALERLYEGSPVEYLRSLVPRGGTILIKPNWVEPSSWASGKITHPALVLAVARIASEALGAEGRVLIGEATSEGPDLPRVLAATGFERALRALTAQRSDSDRAPIRIVDLNGASAGRMSVKLDTLSRFAPYGGVVYDAHGKPMGDGRVGTYLLSRPVLDADLIIDMAKAKVHSSAGVTLALKNLVGVVPSADGPYGDDSLKDVPHFSARDVAAGRRSVGNGTIGRTIADLHAAAAYVGRDGSVQRKVQRKLLCIIDGVVSGQRSQFTPEPVETGWIVAGRDPVAVDHVATRCMGFDPGRVTSLKPSTTGTLGLGTAEPGRVRVVYDGPGVFSGYFSKARRLEPEHVRAEWGDTIALATFDIGQPHVVKNGDMLIVATRADQAIVRLETGGRFAQFPKSEDGSFRIPLPGDRMGDLRLVVMDRHFNRLDQPLTL